MLELMLCSLLTIVPDYLYRRYAQGKQFGKEITLYSVWYELRWGITGCLMLTIGLITMIFYYHPSTTTAAIYFRTVPILPEGSGRVAQVNVGFSQAVKVGKRIYVSGQVGVDNSGAIIGETDLAAQASQAFRELHEVPPPVIYSRGVPRSLVPRAHGASESSRWTP